MKSIARSSGMSGVFGSTPSGASRRVNDGRVGSLRSEAKYKTPKPCRQAGRSCWACVNEECNVVVVEMPKAPTRRPR